VDLLTEYSNRPQILADLLSCMERLQRCEQGKVAATRPSVRNDRPPRATWRVKDRLTAEDVETIITSYKVGVALNELAERYEISRSSVKTLLRTQGVKRPKEHDGRAKGRRQA